MQIGFLLHQVLPPACSLTLLYYVAVASASVSRMEFAASGVSAAVMDTPMARVLPSALKAKYTTAILNESAGSLDR